MKLLFTFPLFFLLAAAQSQPESIEEIRKMVETLKDDQRRQKDEIDRQSQLIDKHTSQIRDLEERTKKLEGAADKSSKIYPEPKVAFTAYFNDGGHLDIGMSKPIAFDKVTINVGDGYDSRTGLFTAPVSGSYLFILSAKASSSAKDRVKLGIFRSSSLVMETDLLGYERANMDQTASFVTLQVKAGEKVEVRHLEGPTVIDKWYETSFTGILLYAD